MLLLKIQKYYIIIILFLIILSCNKKPSSLQEEITKETSPENTLQKELNNNFNKLRIESIAFYEAYQNLEIVVDFLFLEKNQINVFSEAVKIWASIIFKADNINSFSLIYKQGLDNYDKTFYIEVDKASFLQANLTKDSPFQDVYLMATRYFIAPLIKGDLSFVYEGRSVFLNVQKPIYN